MEMITTKNLDWGFYGTLKRNYSFSDKVTANLYNITAHLLADELNLSSEQVVCFLDGKYGRHFADELSFHGMKEGCEEVSGPLIFNYVHKALTRKIEPWILEQAKAQKVYNHED